ncbi:MAG: hypothetical protein ACREB8_18045 [Pseudolabrys sp.]
MAAHWGEIALQFVFYGDIRRIFAAFALISNIPVHYGKPSVNILWAKSFFAWPEFRGPPKVECGIHATDGQKLAVDWSEIVAIARFFGLIAVSRI